MTTSNTQKRKLCTLTSLNCLPHSRLLALDLLLSSWQRVNGKTFKTKPNLIPLDLLNIILNYSKNTFELDIFDDNLITLTKQQCKTIVNYDMDYGSTLLISKQQLKIYDSLTLKLV